MPLAAKLVSVCVVALLTASCASTAAVAPTASARPPSASVTAASASPSGVQPTCDEATITPAVVTAIGADESLRHLNGVQCVDGWALVYPTIGPPDGSSDGEIDITLVFRAQDGAWVEQDRTAVCGTQPTGDASPAYPSDALVPATIWRGACQTN